MHEETSDPMTFEEFYEEHAAIVRRTARKEHQSCQSVDVEDVEQHLWEYFMRYHHLHHDWEPAGIQDLATKKARAYVAKERLDYMYFSGNFVYSTTDVRRILEASAWSELDECPDVEGRVDIRTAFTSLTRGQKHALFRQYALREEPLNGPRGAEQKARERGVDAITHRLNTGKTLAQVSLDLVANEL